MKQYVMNMEPELIKAVDEIVKTEKLYSSRNEFIRDAVRSKVSEQRALKLEKLRKEARETMLARGWNGELITREQKEKTLGKYLKERGLKL